MTNLITDEERKEKVKEQIKNEINCVIMIAQHKEFKHLDSMSLFHLEEMLQLIKNAYVTLRVAELKNPKCTTYTVGCIDCTKD